LSMNLVRRFKSYVNLTTTETKIRRLLSEFSFTTFAEAMSEFRSPTENQDHVKKQDCQVL
jgi:hypothetical protein